jgi:hypothetical protein
MLSGSQSIKSNKIDFKFNDFISFIPVTARQLQNYILRFRFYWVQSFKIHLGSSSSHKGRLYYRQSKATSWGPFSCLTSIPCTPRLFSVPEPVFCLSPVVLDIIKMIIAEIYLNHIL